MSGATVCVYVRDCRVMSANTCARPCRHAHKPSAMQAGGPARPHTLTSWGALNSSPLFCSAAALPVAALTAAAPSTPWANMLKMSQ